MAGRFNMSNNKKTNTHSRSKPSRRTRINSLPSSSSESSRPTAKSTLSVPEDPDDYESPSDFLSAVSIALMGGKFIAGQFYIPGIVVVFEAAIKMVNALRDGEINTREAFRLVRLTSNYTNLLLDHAAELSSIPSASKQMEKLTEHLKKFERICSKVEDIASRITDRNVFVGIFSASSDKDELQYFEQRLKDALGLFQVTPILLYHDLVLDKKCFVDGGSLQDRQERPCNL
ncbi:hypothetical protein Clacol_000724 [Clathrus columnatus]|uniref:Uncharacterized protein n=1 Tax=Clathrus columnatus TaxID=1419009 RepID=A0AAV4ZZ45_9AGAM|nr:hypothetical protein Clacol_000724 [Clathrus columnatus]